MNRIANLLPKSTALSLAAVGLTTVLVSGGVCAQHSAEPAEVDSLDLFNTYEVSGSGIHYFTTAIIHDQQPTETGMIQRSTDIVLLEGDIEGMVLYHPRSVFDFAQGKLINTGHQVFSGTIRGSRPVMLYDDAFRFEVDLATGATVGRVRLVDRLAGPVSRCRLDLVSNGEQTPEGDAIVSYTGTCRVNPRATPND